MDESTRTGRVRSFAPPRLDGDTFEGYKGEIAEFLDRGGVFVVFENAKFNTVLSGMLSGELASRESRVEFYTDTRLGYEALHRLRGRGGTPFLFLDHNDRDDVTILESLRADPQLRDVHAVIVSNQMFEEKVAYFTEKGADDIVVLPYTQNTIITKIVETIAPPRHKALYLEARRLLREGRHEEALEAAGRAVGGYPTYPRAHVVMGEALERLERVAEAIDAYEAALAVERAQMFLEPRLRLADLYGQMAGAFNATPEEAKRFRRKQLTYLEELDRVSPINTNRKILRGRLYLAFGERYKAEGVLREAYREFLASRRNRAESSRREALRLGRDLIDACGDAFPELSQDVLVEILNDPTLASLLSDGERVDLLMDYGSALLGMAALITDGESYEDLFQDCKKVFEDIVALDPGEEKASRAYQRLGDLYRDLGGRLRGGPEGARDMRASDALRVAHGFYAKASEMDAMNLDAREGTEALKEHAGDGRAVYDLDKPGGETAEKRRKENRASKYDLYIDPGKSPFRFGK